MKLCAICKFRIPLNKRIFCVCDAYTCSSVCKAKYLNIISLKDPTFAKPQNWKKYERLSKSTSSFSLDKIENNDVKINIKSDINSNKSFLYNLEKHIAYAESINSNIYLFFIYENYNCLYNIYRKVFKNII